jgi:hypothetical protein
MHDWSLKPEECPWADKAPWLGGKNAGSWVSPMIGDIVWIAFEKQHPYGPVWIGFASPTRRMYYPLESTYTYSPMAVDLDGKSTEAPEDYLEEYLPRDLRPMSLGWRDRYGSFDIASAIGFYPSEHDNTPASTGQDAVAKQQFPTGFKPEVNKPDRKYLARVTKYGIYEILSDVGYYWKQDEEYGEFKGDFDKDQDFEIQRSFYLTKLLNEGVPCSEDQDQRRYEVRTRAGHKFEMRDVGWAQAGGAVAGREKVEYCKSRDGEYGDPRILSEWDKTDERWIKLRSKGGHLIQLMDMGFHPEKDAFYKRLLSKECGATDGEYGNWTGRDSRQIRFVTRWGVKCVLDDRGSDPLEADSKELPRGNGWLLKTRRGWQVVDSIACGFGFEANDKDELDTTRWYTPKSKIIELNDRKDYMMFCTDTGKEISEDWKYLDENEFALNIAMTLNPERDTYHLKLDKANGYLRLKTSGGHDNARHPEPEPFFDVLTPGLNQGLEARDGRVGIDGAWTELVDLEERGIWLSQKVGLGILRSKRDKDLCIAIIDRDGNEKIVIRNGHNGVLQLYCKGDVQIIADRNITLKGGERIMLDAKEVAYNGQLLHKEVDGVKPVEVEKRSPSDRAVVDNGPYSKVDKAVVKGT